MQNEFRILNSEHLKSCIFYSAFSLTSYIFEFHLEYYNTRTLFEVIWSKVICIQYVYLKKKYTYKQNIHTKLLFHL